MSTAGLVWVLTVIVMFALGAPIALAMFTSSVIYIFLQGIDPAMVMDTMIVTFEGGFVLLAVPLFIFTAKVMNTGGITERLFGFADSMVGHWAGGLAHVNVVNSMIFAGMTGSAVADASGIGIMEIEAMSSHGYGRSFSAAVSAASATIGPIIPPSIPMVIYAMLAEASVGYLFLGGFIPGVIMGVAMMIYIASVARKRKFPRGERVNWERFRTAFIRAILALLTPVILLGGIYSGVFTPTEAAAVAALYALIVTILIYQLVSLRQLLALLRESVESTGFLSFIIATSYIFSYVVAREEVAHRVTQLLMGITTSRAVMFLILNLLFLVLGCFLDTNVIMLVVIPIILPVVRALGIDLVHFGVVVVLNLMIGLTTPPYGVLLFIVSGLGKAPLSEVIREIVPFIGMLIIVLFLITYVPDLVLFLPRLFGYKG